MNYILSKSFDPNTLAVCQEFDFHYIIRIPVESSVLEPISIYNNLVWEYLEMFYHYDSDKFYPTLDRLFVYTSPNISPTKIEVYQELELLFTIRNFHLPCSLSNSGFRNFSTSGGILNPGRLV